MPDVVAERERERKICQSGVIIYFYSRIYRQTLDNIYNVYVYIVLS